jgi:predicted Zn-dependent protease
MLAAGYDPAAMVDMLTLLEKQESGAKGGFVSTHPSPQNRLSRVNTELNKQPYKGAKSQGRDVRNGRYKNTRS